MPRMYDGSYLFSYPEIHLRTLNIKQA